MKNLLYDISNLLENYPETFLVDETNIATSNLSDDDLEYLKELLKQFQEQGESLTVTIKKLLEILPVDETNVITSNSLNSDYLEELAKQFEEQAKSLKVTINKLRENFPEIEFL